MIDLNHLSGTLTTTTIVSNAATGGMHL